MKYFVALIVLITSCTAEHVRPKNSPLLQSYAESFAADGASHGHKIDITGLEIYFHSLSSAAAGVTNNGVVVVDSTSLCWKINPEAVVYHELGHKYLHRGHYDDVYPPKSLIENSIPKSIMNSHFMYKYTSDREYYITELFQ